MNTSTIQGDWTELKGKIKTQWAKLNDNDVDALQGDLEQLTGKVQKAYGYGKEKAEQEIQKFKKTLESVGKN